MKVLYLVLIAATLGSAASAQPQRWTVANVPRGYVLGFDGCPHRTPQSVLHGLPLISCQSQPNKQPGPPPSYVTATPAQVIAALDCDFATATRATKGKPSDLAKAVITGTLKFSLVTKSSAGFTLAVAAIPVFPIGTPSLDASRLKDTTSSDSWTISVDPLAVSACANPSTNNWLTSRVLLNGGMVQVDKFETNISFLVTKQGGAGLKLNIVPVSVGPQFSATVENTQSLSLTVDYTKKQSQTAAQRTVVIPATSTTRSIVVPDAQPVAKPK